MTGKVKKLTRNRAFGFIRGDNGVDYFFHRTDLCGNLTIEKLGEGQRVTFETAERAKGPRARDVNAS